ncbi:MAG: hypothetical protein GY714_31505 [Desulfobacterales bacterium]|nr:hypothetical protein [Desulfobacterales bacterium]MCP4163778.1 hypothetical protein [Deltaproteobacteria bacterium]
MRYDKIYNELKEIAEKLKITVSEQNFRPTGIKVQSGLCNIRGEDFYIMDKHKKIREKTELLAQCLLNFPLDDMYIIPAIRDYFDKFKKTI